MIAIPKRPARTGRSNPIKALNHVCAAEISRGTVVQWNWNITRRSRSRPPRKNDCNNNHFKRLLFCRFARTNEFHGRWKVYRRCNCWKTETPTVWNARLASSTGDVSFLFSHTYRTARTYYRCFSRCRVTSKNTYKMISSSLPEKGLTVKCKDSIAKVL